MPRGKCKGGGKAFPLPQEGEFECQILSFCAGKDSAVGKWGLKPFSSDSQGLLPLWGHQGFIQEKNTPEQPARQSEVQARGTKGPPPNPRWLQACPTPAETWPHS